MGKLLDSSICLFSYQKTNLKRINDISRVSAKKAIKKIGGAQKKIDIASSQHYATREILWYDKMNVECPYFDKGNLTKPKKNEILVLLEQLLDTLEYQFVTAGTSVIVDFMSLSGETGFEKNPKVRDVFDSAWEIILAASNSDRIKIVYNTYLEVSIKELTRIGRAKEKSIEIINLNLDSPVSIEITKFWAFSVHKEHLQILSGNYFLMKGKEKEKNMIVSGK